MAITATDTIASVASVIRIHFGQWDRTGTLAPSYSVKGGLRVGKLGSRLLRDGNG